MANPQAEHGHLRIANEVWEQVMMSQFNREQRAILDLVLRLSWGCGKKAAHIPKQRHFCLGGVYESHVKKELKWLEKARVLIIDWDRKLYQFNKDYDAWRVSIVPNYDEEELLELVRLNLQIGKNDGANDLQISKIDPSELTNKEETNPENLQISKIGEPETPSTAGFEASLKQDLKPYVKEEAAWKEITERHHDLFDRLLGPTQYQVLQMFVGDGLPLEVLCHLYQYAASRQDTVHGFGFIETVARDWLREGITTAEEADAYQKRRDEKVKRRRTAVSPRGHPIASESKPGENPYKTTYE